MSELSPEIVDTVLAACQAGAEEAAGAITRGLGFEATLTVGQAGAWKSDELPSGFDGPGLLAQFAIEGVSAAVALPADSGLLPDWVQSPDATGESKLSTLAQELSMLLLPETLMAEDFRAGWVPQLADAFAAGGVANDSPLIPIELASGDTTTQLTLVWPLPTGGEMFPPGEEDEKAVEESETAQSSNANPSSGGDEAAATAKGPEKREWRPTDFCELPPIAKNILRIKVPVRVNLVSTQLNIRDIVDLVPGSIINFEKSCDAPIEVYVNNRQAAIGDAVKVGERFGVQITDMVMPPESFAIVRTGKAG